MYFAWIGKWRSENRRHDEYNLFSLYQKKKQKTQKNLSFQSAFSEMNWFISAFCPSPSVMWYTIHSARLQTMYSNLKAASFGRISNIEHFTNFALCPVYVFIHQKRVFEVQKENRNTKDLNRSQKILSQC